MILDRYYVEEIIDHHNDTSVIKCTDTRLDVPSVMKILLADPDSPVWEKRKDEFVKAFRTQAKLAHPNVVQVSNIETRKNLVFAVMERLEGVTLDVLLAEKSLETSEIAEIYKGVIDAVVLGQSTDVLHLNISPRNIFLTRMGSHFIPHVLNFAYGRDIQTLDPISALPFVSPEQLGGFDRATKASDVFSLCAGIFFALVHRPPCVFGNLQGYADFYATHTGIDAAIDGIPRAFQEILTIGLRSDMQYRFPTAADLQEAILSIGDDFDTAPKLKPLPQPPAPAPISSAQPIPPMAARSSSQPPVPAARVPSQPSVPTARVPSQPSVPPPPRTPSQPVSASSSQSQPIPKPSKSTSQQIVVPTLPPSIAYTHTLMRMDSDREHAWVCAVSPNGFPQNTLSLKLLKNSSPDALKSFFDGVQMGVDLTAACPNFQTILQILPEGGYLAPDVPRQSLPAYIQQNGPLNVVSTLQLGICIAQSMETSHLHGFVNGNLKPSNIILESRNGILVPIIYDFAQNAHINSAASLSINDIPYVDPSLDYNLSMATPQSDIFSFGMLLIYMLSGMTPYRSTTPGELVSEIDACNGSLCLEQILPSLTPDFLSVLRWCTVFDPSGRYTSFDRLLQDLCYVYNQAAQPMPM